MPTRRYPQRSARFARRRPRSTGAWRALDSATSLRHAWLALAASLGLGGAANAEFPDRWQPEPDVGLLAGVVLRIHWLDSADELVEAARQSGQSVKETNLKGFSLLKRNTKTGEYACDVYVVKLTGAYVDNERTTTFGHEILHCLGLRHRDQRVARIQ